MGRQVIQGFGSFIDLDMNLNGIEKRENLHEVIA